jgi:hypothetical protein
MTKIEVTNKLKNSINELSATLTSIPEKDFYVRADNKWSPAEQAEHLKLSVKPLLLAYTLPKLVLRLLFGKPNRPGRDYAAILDKYHNKLKSGGVASAPFIPKQLKTATSPQAVNAEFVRIHERFIAISSKWDDKQLDNYLLPHPLLGKITMREMLYFTDLHILHHNKLIHQYYL